MPRIERYITKSLNFPNKQDPNKESAWRPDVSVTGGVYVTERHYSGCGAAAAGNTAHCMGAGACVTP